MISNESRPRTAPSYPLRPLVHAALLHYLAYVAMQTMALFAETRRGPTLPDLLLDLVGPRRDFDWLNQVLWLPVLLGSIFLFALLRPAAAVNYLRAGAAVSLMRGVFISLTSIGPPAAMRAHAPQVLLALTPAGIGPDLLFAQWLPLDFFRDDSALSAAHLTQDLFFSGHTASTFLLLLVAGVRSRGFFPLLCFHGTVVFLLVLTHEHYSIDILGAYFVTYAVWKFLEARGWLLIETGGQGAPATEPT